MRRIIFLFLLIGLSFDLFCGDMKISINRNEDIYEIKAVFSSTASTEQVKNVLTDYENIPRYMPSIKESIIKESGDGYIMLEQKGRQKIVSFFSISMNVILKVTESAGKIFFEDTLKRDFRFYSGSWALSAFPGGTKIEYSLKVIPSMYVPAFIAKKIFVARAEDMCRDIITEAERRAGN